MRRGLSTFSIGNCIGAYAYIANYTPNILGSIVLKRVLRTIHLPLNLNMFGDELMPSDAVSTYWRSDISQRPMLLARGF
jgi:hypothetical protein